MDANKIKELDRLLLEARKSVDANELIFDKKGNPIMPMIDKDICNRLCKLISEFSPQNLYRYRNGSEWDLDNLINGDLWVSALRELNDPFENMIYFNFQSIAIDSIQSNKEIMDLMDKHVVDNKDPIYLKYIEDIKSCGEKLKKELNIKRDRIFMACFSECKSSLLMWAHYANAHKGYCIGYKFNDIFDLYGINILPVTYTKDFLTIDNLETFKDHHETFIKACKTKSLEWSYEKEWRLLGRYKINDPYEKGLTMKMPNPICIYMGVNIDNNLKSKLVNICKEKKIELYQMRISEKSYRLIAYNVSY